MESVTICENQKYLVLKKQIHHRTWTAGPDEAEFSASLYVYFLMNRDRQTLDPIDVQYSLASLADTDDKTFFFEDENTLKWKRHWVVGLINTGALGDRPAIETREVTLNLGQDQKIMTPNIFFSKRRILKNQFSSETMTFHYPEFGLCWDLQKHSLEIAIRLSFE